MKARVLELAIALAIVFGFLTLAGGCIRKDNTDSPTERSNMRPHVDHLTGCQYLSTYRGGITPRMDGRGKQLCREN